MKTDFNEETATEIEELIYEGFVTVEDCSMAILGDGTLCPVHVQSLSELNSKFKTKQDAVAFWAKGYALAMHAKQARPEDALQLQTMMKYIVTTMLKWRADTDEFIAGLNAQV